MKKVISLFLASIIILMSVVCVSAADDVNKEIDVKILNDTVVLKDKEIYCCTYNISENYQWGVQLRFGDEKQNKIPIKGKDCIDEPYRLPMMGNVKYYLSTIGGGAESGDQRYRYDDTGGVYQKMRYKLSNDPYFNEDGSHTRNGFDYYFGDRQVYGTDHCSACLVIVSGGAINFVAPDKDGYVEFYVSTDISEYICYFTDYSYKKGSAVGGGGGTNGHNIKGLAKGITRNDYYVSISDATQIQRYIAKIGKFNELQTYTADVDCNGAIDIFDATLIQKYLAKMYGY